MVSDIGDLKQTVTEVVITVVREELKPIKQILDEHTDKIDALMAEMHDMHQTTKAIWEKIDIDREVQEREIDRIKEHIGMPAQN